METDVLAILMVAFALFAILMFVLFYVYAKKTRNRKYSDEDYEIEDDTPHEEIVENPEFNKEEEIDNNFQEFINNIDEYLAKDETFGKINDITNIVEVSNNELEEFVPKKKKV